MARAKMTSKEYPAQFADVVMKAHAGYEAGAFIAAWPIPGGHNAARATLHRFNRYRNLLWEEESPFAVSAKDLTATLQYVRETWHVVFHVLGLYSQQEKIDSVSGAAQRLAREMKEHRLEVTIEAPALPLGEEPVVDHRLVNKPPTISFDEAMSKHGYEPVKKEEAAVECQHELNEMTDACALCGVPKDRWPK